MPIKITDDPVVEVTADELAFYTQEYQQRYMMFAGKVPTLAEFIRREKAKLSLKERMKNISNG